jgi:hypothetical protein
MSKTIKPEMFAQAVKEYLEIYVEDIGETVEETSNQIGKEARDELKQTSPKKTGKYAKGWTVRKDKKNKNYYTVKVWNRTDYQLTHLLEFGHATKNGGRTKAIPHIRPVEEKYKNKFEKQLKDKIRRNSK